MKPVTVKTPSRMRIKVSSKGQVTLPQALREQMQIKPGDFLQLDYIAETQTFNVTRVRCLSELAGMFKQYAKPGMTIEKERAGVRAARMKEFAREYGRSGK
jgi:AbrB family looped-hinge helix DNA binding protein